MNDAVILATGGFDPIHRGHLEYLSAASKLFDYPLWIGISSNDMLQQKKGFFFQDILDRKMLLDALEYSEFVFEVISEDASANSAIEYTLQFFEKVYFVNGGDKTINNIPEYEIWKDDSKVIFIDNVGGEKIDSSSHLLDRYADIIMSTDTRI